MDSKIILPIEVINKILVMRPKHPIAELMQKEIRSWSRKCYFYKHFFNKHNIIKLKKERDYNRKCYDYTFKSLVKDGKICNFDAVNLIHESKLEEQRLNRRLEELNIKSYEISTSKFFPNKNKHGNFTTVKYKSNEILF